MKIQHTLILVLFLTLSYAFTNKNIEKVMPGAEQLEEYLPKLKNKRVGLVVNATSRVQHTHLVDTLLACGVSIQKIFAPEHGFRGDADAGQKVDDGTDAKTGLPIASLYGAVKKPTQAMLQDVDILVFDMQDVGARFFTYISTLHYVMEACAAYQTPLLVLDRPNPNGHYIDGPILDLRFRSFIGMHPIPIVHGLTLGELARMINGEGWLESQQKCMFEVISVKNYTHKTPYSLPYKPSPNLPNDHAIAFYPSLCLFEATMMSEGRGTLFPFEVVGYPEKRFGSFQFTPRSISGAQHPKYENQSCFGIDLRDIPVPNCIKLQYIINFYRMADPQQKESFFSTINFSIRAGNNVLQKQIQKGLSEKQIRATWQEGLKKYRAMRKKYLLYKD